MQQELILGGQKSGKSRCAEQRAAAWLARGGTSAVLLATALAGDDEMAERIARHRLDRAQRVPALQTLEVPHDLPQAIKHHSAPDRLVLVDCLTLWLTNLLMPLHPLAPSPAFSEAQLARLRGALYEALRAAAGPVVLVSNEIGLGVSPLSPEARRFVDELGSLHQAVAALCPRVTFMVAGIEQAVKGASA